MIITGFFFMNKEIEFYFIGYNYFIAIMNAVVVIGMIFTNELCRI